MAHDLSEDDRKAIREWTTGGPKVGHGTRTPDRLPDDEENRAWTFYVGGGRLKTRLPSEGFFNRYTDARP